MSFPSESHQFYSISDSFHVIFFGPSLPRYMYLVLLKCSKPDFCCFLETEFWPKLQFFTALWNLCSTIDICGKSSLYMYYTGVLFACFRFLGHLYAAEALIKLNRLPEAIMHLAPENINNISITPPSTTADSSSGNQFVRSFFCEKKWRYMHIWSLFLISFMLWIALSQRTFGLHFFDYLYLCCFTFFLQNQWNKSLNVAKL